MATFTQNSILGETGTFPTFVTGTKLWNAGQAFAGLTTVQDSDPAVGTITVTAPPEELNVGSSTVTIDGSIALTTRLNGLSAGNLIIRNGGVLNYANTSILTGADQTYGLDWEDFLVIGTPPGYIYQGAFGATGAPVYRLVNGRVNLDVNQTDFTEQFYLLFAGNIAANSTISNVSFWNGETGARSKGGVPGLTTSANYSGLTLGPAGLWTNTADALVHERNIIRFANQGVNGITQTNHLCWMGNLDFRALSGITTTNAPTGTNSGDQPTSGDELRSWTIVTDTQANVWLINPYIGRPTVSGTGLANGRLSFCSYFQLGRAKTLTGTNPVKTGPGSRLHTFTQTDVDSGIYQVPAVVPSGVNAANIPLPLTSRVLGHTGAGINGFLFEQQDFVGSTPGGNSPSLNARTTIAPLADRSYRVYDWLQQPANTEFGVLISLPALTEGATDAQVTAAIAAGYDTFDSGFTTTTPLNYDVDLPVVDSGFTEVSILAAINTSGVKTGYEIAATAKSLAWEEAKTSNAANDKINLLHSYTGTTLLFGPRELYFSAAASGTGYDIADNATTNVSTVFRASEVTTADVLTRITTTGNLLFIDGFGATTATNKIDFRGGDVDFSTGTSGYRNMTVSSLRDIDLNANTYENCTFGSVGGQTAAIIIRNQATITNSTFDDVFSIGTQGNPYSVENVALSGVTYTGTSALEFVSTESRITLDDLLGTGFVITGGATITLRSQNAIQLEVVNTVLPAGLVLHANSNITLVELEVIETITIPSVLSGYYGVTTGAVGSEVVLHDVTRIVAGVTASFPLSSNIHTTGSTVNIYIKYDNDISNQLVYNANRVSHITGAGNLTTVDAEPVTSALVGNVTSSRAGTTYTIVDDVNTPSFGFVTISGASAVRESLEESQGLAAEIANEQKYFEVYFDNRLSADIILWGSNANVQWNRDVFTFQSGNTQVATLAVNGQPGTTADVITPFPQLIGNWSSVSPTSNSSSIFALQRGGVLELNADTGGVAPLSVIANAAQVGIEQSTVSGSVTDIAQVAGWISLGESNVLPVGAAFDATDPGNRYINNI